MLFSVLIVEEYHVFFLLSLQVDHRILKAFAIEHPKDIDAAAESILVDVLPSLTTSYDASCTVQDTNEVKHPSTSGNVAFGL